MQWVERFTRMLAITFLFQPLRFEVSFKIVPQRSHPFDIRGSKMIFLGSAIQVKFGASWNCQQSNESHKRKWDTTSQIPNGFPMISHISY